MKQNGERKQLFRWLAIAERQKRISILVLCHENDSIRVRTPVPRQYGMPKPTWLYMYTCDELDGLWDHAAITFGEGILWIHDENGVNTLDDFHNNLIKIKWKKQRKVQ